MARMPRKHRPKRRCYLAQSNELLTLVEESLADMKAREVTVLDVRDLTSITDYMIVASGNSDRHVRSIADRLIDNAKKAGYPPLGLEGQEYGEWVLVDLDEIVIHIMQPRVRDFYKLENLWDMAGNSGSANAENAH
jgi:ribosome-associated protein